jgi:hypothetical protein
MDPGEPQTSSEGRTDGGLPDVKRPPRLRRVRLWQAIAGMSVAIALGSLIVISELAGALTRRTDYVNRRVAALNAIVRSLRRQTVTEQRKLGSEREHATVGEVFEKILFAPDLSTIKLGAPIEKDREKEKSTAQPGASDVASGRLAMSKEADAAILEASGLKPTGTFQVYRIWWTPKHGAPIWAADFLVGDDGGATVPLDLPPGREKKLSLSVTLENESYSEEPSGPVALKSEPSAGAAQNPHKPRH